MYEYCIIPGLLCAMISGVGSNIILFKKKQLENGKVNRLHNGVQLVPSGEGITSPQLLCSCIVHFVGIAGKYYYCLKIQFKYIYFVVLEKLNLPYFIII